MRLALVLLLVCSTARAEDPRTVDVHHGTLVPEPGDVAPIEVGSGCWLREDVCVTAGQEVADLRQQQAAVAVVVAVAVALAFGAGYATAQVSK